MEAWTRRRKNALQRMRPPLCETGAQKAARPEIAPAIELAGPGWSTAAKSVQIIAKTCQSGRNPGGKACFKSQISNLVPKGCEKHDVTAQWLRLKLTL